LDLKIKKATFPSYPGKNGCAFKIIINSSAEERSINKFMIACQKYSCKHLEQGTAILLAGITAVPYILPSIA